MLPRVRVQPVALRIEVARMEKKKGELEAASVEANEAASAFGGRGEYQDAATKQAESKTLAEEAEAFVEQVAGMKKQLAAAEAAAQAQEMQSSHADVSTHFESALRNDAMSSRSTPVIF